jgi:hypothetical protein
MRISIRNQYIYGIVVFAIIICLVSCKEAKVKIPKEDAKAELPKEDVTDIGDLVEQLASPNPEPFIADEYTIIYAPNYDKEAQNRIHKIRIQIEDRGLDAFPYLIEHYNDDRYSVTIETDWNACFYNKSVRSECCNIIQSQLEPLGAFVIDAVHAGQKRPRYNFDFVYSKEEMQSWLRANKNKSLRELQIEILEWTLAEEKKQNKPKFIEDIKISFTRTG